jgi:hypothetical protein
MSISLFLCIIIASYIVPALILLAFFRHTEDKYKELAVTREERDILKKPWASSPHSEMKYGFIAKYGAEIRRWI